MTHQISNKTISIQEMYQITKSHTKIELSEESKSQIKKAQSYLENLVTKSEEAVYGVNTGFGYLCNYKIPKDQINELQENLVMSHACGVGDEVPAFIIRLMLLLKIQSLSYGHSGVQLQTVERFVDFYNEDILPVVYELGSLGASGDLAPLAHLALPIIGMGEVWMKNKKGTYQKKKTEDVLKQKNWKPIQLKAKEGLAMLNGTQFMSAYGVACMVEAEKMNTLSDTIGALSADAFLCRSEPFNALTHKIRPHAGQIRTAKNIRELLEGSEIMLQPKAHVQDPYSFRCMPQVHGASKGAFDYINSVFECEINSVTDNPNVFPDEDVILSGGNFHGQPLAISLDFAAIALAELGSISERRTYLLMAGERNLPPFLVHDSGLHSGMMIAQYTAASIVSQNKQLCTPASVDSIISSKGQEDHVSMGANAATKLYKVLQNVKRILAIELMAAAQAIEFRRPLKTSDELEEFLAEYRKNVKPLQKDRVLHDDIMKSVDFIETI
ncbi:histidine ammonia-lyase [Bernardetia sp.]|uniref:histidine ammonia-lyase n=1 Tax=Bernardetia sp. TaxID=1937974 RepID=UPI0025C388B3|nr:histidine ammonia-lyase [Bernardetia sp.]